MGLGDAGGDGDAADAVGDAGGVGEDACGEARAERYVTQGETAQVGVAGCGGIGGGAGDGDGVGLDRAVLGGHFHADAGIAHAEADRARGCGRGNGCPVDLHTGVGLGDAGGDDEAADAVGDAGGVGEDACGEVRAERAITQGETAQVGIGGGGVLAGSCTNAAEIARRIGLAGAHREAGPVNQAAHIQGRGEGARPVTGGAATDAAHIDGHIPVVDGACAADRIGRHVGCRNHRRGGEGEDRGGRILARGGAGAAEITRRIGLAGAHRETGPVNQAAHIQRRGEVARPVTGGVATDAAHIDGHIPVVNGACAADRIGRHVGCRNHRRGGEGEDGGDTIVGTAELGGDAVAVPCRIRRDPGGNIHRHRPVCRRQVDGVDAATHGGEGAQRGVCHAETIDGEAGHVFAEGDGDEDGAGVGRVAHARANHDGGGNRILARRGADGTEIARRIGLARAYREARPVAEAAHIQRGGEGARPITGGTPTDAAHADGHIPIARGAGATDWIGGYVAKGDHRRGGEGEDRGNRILAGGGAGAAEIARRIGLTGAHRDAGSVNQATHIQIPREGARVTTGDAATDAAHADGHIPIARGACATDRIGVYVAARDSRRGGEGKDGRDTVVGTAELGGDRVAVPHCIRRDPGGNIHRHRPIRRRRQVERVNAAAHSGEVTRRRVAQREVTLDEANHIFAEGDGNEEGAGVGRVAHTRAKYDGGGGPVNRVNLTRSKVAVARTAPAKGYRRGTGDDTIIIYQIEPDCPALVGNGIHRNAPGRPAAADRTDGCGTLSARRSEGEVGGIHAGDGHVEGDRERGDGGLGVAGGPGPRDTAYSGNRNSRHPVGG